MPVHSALNHMSHKPLLDPRSIEIIQHIPPMKLDAVAHVRELEALSLTCDQLVIPTQHIIHGGMYARTVTIPKGAMLTGALVEIPTMLIVAGHCLVFIGEESIEVKGYHCFAAATGRKQAFNALEDTHITMLFPTTAKTVAEAEDWFTDEAHLLFSRKPDAQNITTITGE